MKTTFNEKNILSVAIGAALLLSAGAASAHGYISSPASRSFLCSQGGNVDCGSIQYEPQSLEGPKGFPQGGPADGHIASAGKDQYHELDAQTPTRWKQVDQKTGDMNFVWTLTKEHATESWDYYLTKPDWNQNKPLTRADFDLTPFCHYDGKGQVPTTPVVQKCTIPADRKGYNVILGVWSISDTSNAFYQVEDVNLK
ncbi:MAG: lytic polysaccharide monooxygenase [Ewingella sp.]|uniref:lytic polysaccharide monooxygenase n=1 Tax=Ewingella TaxID=41201 RepID=UPI00336546DE